MAYKVIETKTGEVIKTEKQVKRERTVRKVQKYISVSAIVMLTLMMSALTVFADGEVSTGTPEGVDTSTVSSFGSIIWWIVRIVILALGGIPGLINFVKGMSDEDHRQRNGGLITLIATAAAFAATFALQGIIGF